MSIEDIILQNDNRGVSQLRKHLPENFCMETAQKLLNNGSKVIMGTGFYIYSLDAPETDGPVGVAFLAKALRVSVICAIGSYSISISSIASSAIARFLATTLTTGCPS